MGLGVRLIHLLTRLSKFPRNLLVQLSDRCVSLLQALGGSQDQLPERFRDAVQLAESLEFRQLVFHLLTSPSTGPSRMSGIGSWNGASYRDIRLFLSRQKLQTI